MTAPPAANARGRTRVLRRDATRVAALLAIGCALAYTSAFLGVLVAEFAGGRVREVWRHDRPGGVSVYFSAERHPGRTLLSATIPLPRAAADRLDALRASPPTLTVEDPVPWWLVPSRQPRRQSAHGVAAGWPLRCAWGRTDADVNSRPQRVDTGLVRLRVAGRELAVPWRPLWAGLVANAAVYAAAIALLAALSRRLGAWRRRRRGRCPACGYDLTNLPTTDTGDPRCPECGHLPNA